MWQNLFENGTVCDFFCWNASKYFADNAKWLKATFIERQVKALTHYQLSQLFSHSDSWRAQLKTNSTLTIFTVQSLSQHKAIILSTVKQSGYYLKATTDVNLLPPYYHTVKNISKHTTSITECIYFLYCSIHGIGEYTRDFLVNSCG